MSYRVRTPRPRWRVWPWPALTLAGVLVIVVAAVIGATANSEPTGEATPTASPTPTPPQPVPSNPRSKFGTGLVVVGIDIRPGTYRTAGPSGTPGCYWSRYTTGGISMIDNGVISGAGTITVNAGEMIETAGCRPWRWQSAS